MTTYIVLASESAPEWEVVAAEVVAANGDAAIVAVRDHATDRGDLYVGGEETGTLLTDPAVLFVAVPVSKWKPRQMQKQMVERWALAEAVTDA